MGHLGFFLLRAPQMYKSSLVSLKLRFWTALTRNLGVSRARGWPGQALALGLGSKFVLDQASVSLLGF